MTHTDPHLITTGEYSISPGLKGVCDCICNDCDSGSDEFLCICPDCAITGTLPDGRPHCYHKDPREKGTPMPLKAGDRFQYKLSPTSSVRVGSAERYYITYISDTWVTYTAHRAETGEQIGKEQVTTRGEFDLRFEPHPKTLVEEIEALPTTNAGMSLSRAQVLSVVRRYEGS